MTAVRKALIALLTEWDMHAGQVLAEWCEERELVGMATLLREGLAIDSPWRVVRELENLAFMLGIAEHAPVVAGLAEWSKDGLARSRVEAYTFGEFRFAADMPPRVQSRFGRPNADTVILEATVTMRTRILRIILDPSVASKVWLHQILLSGKETLLNGGPLPGESLNLLSRLGIGFPDMYPGERIEFRLENRTREEFDVVVSGLVRAYW